MDIRTQLGNISITPKTINDQLSKVDFAKGYRQQKTPQVEKAKTISVPVLEDLSKDPTGKKRWTERHADTPVSFNVGGALPDIPTVMQQISFKETVGSPIQTISLSMGKDSAGNSTIVGGSLGEQALSGEQVIDLLQKVAKRGGIYPNPEYYDSEFIPTKRGDNKVTLPLQDIAPRGYKWTPLYDYQDEEWPFSPGPVGKA